MKQLKIDVKKKSAFRSVIAVVVMGLSISIGLSMFYADITLNTATILGLVVAFVWAVIYADTDPSPGLYKNGKYLGKIYRAFIKVGDNVALGKKRDTETIGYLKILKDGKEVAKLYLTAEGFMELKPDKIWEVFPEIKGKVERFEKLFKVGDYTLQYNFFQESLSTGYVYENVMEDKFRKSVFDPAYSALIQNIYHRDD
ncbi:hypothetical protein Thal_0855 [Thermocrinis albus DSM 14484]|uniref:Uncharacterized protein n=1 Tax=Thermocrinis albus (strain DSM 14484 / JCM 11386 / HI 11/12) TaxID=638303 RepID=D3SL58_THEAH|nr:hypothetical protein [Thermocrinis albus]ADC89488.1 hypothetical protein Thal_0855 [Thermocrinis albus DSM 14484]